MIVLQSVALALVGLVGTALVLTRDLVRLVLVAGLYALVLILLFVVLQAPDVALSELVVGVLAVPLVPIVALVKGRGA